ncbi:MAG TPA: DUF1501 domain-containing protein [Planctomycetota bacterium]|nr:DUF1501 domain-containing protein [Planctomycetota bacterium]
MPPRSQRRNAPPVTRREMLCRCAMGLGATGLAALLAEAGFVGSASADEEAANPLAARRSHFAARAKRVIHIFANGGPSHVDTFDPKPALERYAGKSLPTPNLRTERKTGAAFPSPFRFQRYGTGDVEVSEIFPRIASLADEIAVLRGMYAEVPNHEPSLLLMNCGDAVRSRPSVGSWVTYGLGSENQNLPGFIAMCPGGYPIKEAENWQSGFLPGVFQGTFIDTQHRSIDKLIEHIRSKTTSLEDQRRQLDLLADLNEDHARRRADDARLDARIQSFELAYRMQIEAAEAFDVRHEPASIRELYGADLPAAEGGLQGRQMLVARRLVERGVRFVQVWHGAGQPWDNHDEIEKNHRKLAAESDRAVGALLLDLKQRGLLEDTLVLWGGEFGRTPTVELKDSGKRSEGRDHNPYGFSVWLAGGGVKGGTVHGATDEFGFRAIEGRTSVHDLHATVLHLLGFDHERLTYRYAGRDFRLTDVSGQVVRDIIA